MDDITNSPQPSSSQCQARRKRSISSPQSRTFPTHKSPNESQSLDCVPRKHTPCFPLRRSVSTVFTLPPTTEASPILTGIPAQSMSSATEQERSSEEGRHTSIQNAPIDFHSSVSPPTWISTPPTPPPRVVRRSVTCSTRQPFISINPSASFPTSMPIHSVEEHQGLLESNTSPSVTFSRLRASSDSFLTFKGFSDSHVNQSLLLSPRPSQTPFTLAAGHLQASDSAGHPSPPRRLKSIFHISVEADTDNEDIISNAGHGSGGSHEDASAESGSRGDSSSYSAQVKDDIRRYHALKELLTTELGYLNDLRDLVSVYLRSLPTLACRTPVPSSSAFSRASSFTSATWCNHPHVQIAATSNMSISDSQTLLQPSTTKDQKGAARYLFDNADIETLTRNAEELLALHEHFVTELRNVVTPLGFSFFDTSETEDHWETIRGGWLDQAIGAVSTKFATEASRFNSYQAFCAGHPEAVDLIRRVAQQHPIEWDGFESRCASAVSGVKTPADGLPVVEPSTTTKSLSAKDRKRTSSLTSLDGAVRSLRSFTNISIRDGPLSPNEAPKDHSGRRLALLDYMIKPIQRICKYPLLLVQLKTSIPASAPVSPNIIRSDVNVVVESAAQAMRHVATAVDEARRRQDVAVQSSLILSRIILADLSAGLTTSASPVAYRMLTPIFLSSLGTCLFAGSLDVIHHHLFHPPDYLTNIKAKYLGAFLYLGGYLILVKVSKGKVYEPRHWFPLSDFGIDDVDEMDAMLPCSFHLSCKGHRFELAAACQREKDAWLAALRESLTHPPSWENEPTSSLQLDGKGDLIPSTLDDGPFETINALPTIQSIPELATDETPPESDFVTPVTKGDSKRRKPLKLDTKLAFSDTFSRRSSTASVKALFNPLSSDSETVVIRRSAAAARSQVDQGLQDVISQPCLTARSYASSREEELFQAPKVTRSGFTRSNSGMSVSSLAKNPLSRHESVRVLRRKSLIDGPDLAVPRRQLSKAKSLAVRKPSKRAALATMSEGEHEPHDKNQESFFAFSPFSRTSSASASGQSSPSTVSSNKLVFPLTPPSDGVESTGTSPKPSRFASGSMRNFFHPSRESPSVALLPPSFPPVPDQDSPIQPVKPTTPSLLRRLTKGSLHRRGGSIPENPDGLAVPKPDPEKEALASSQEFGLLSPISSPDLIVVTDTSASPLSTKSSRRRSFLHPILNHRSSVTEGDADPVKPISFLQRLKA